MCSLRNYHRLLLHFGASPEMSVCFHRVQAVHSQSVSLYNAPLPPVNDPLALKELSRFRSVLSSASRPSDLPRKILITGAMGQLGRSLASVLGALLGLERVLLSDICSMPLELQGNRMPFGANLEFQIFLAEECRYRYLDILDRRSIEQLVVDERVDTIVHLSALLSALGEQNVEQALRVNCQGVQARDQRSKHPYGSYSP